MIYSIIIPVYNSTNSLIQLVDRIEKVFNNEIGEDYEIVFVDDHSPNPETWPVLEKLSKNNKKVKSIQLTRNFGQQAATLCGMENSKGEYVVTMDDDLQHLPEEIIKLIDHKEHDIVIGSMQNKKHSMFKRVTSRIKGWFDYVIIGKPKHIRLSPFRLIKRNVVSGMLQIKTPKPFIPALMFYVTKDIYNVKVNHSARLEGKSNYSFFRMVSLFSNLLINNSSLLLRILGVLGILISFASFSYGAFILIKKLIYNESPVGWTSVIVTVLMLGGMILFSIGVIGEYLIRIISGIESKPTFLIKEIRND